MFNFVSLLKYKRQINLHLNPMKKLMSEELINCVIVLSVKSHNSTQFVEDELSPQIHV